MSATFPDEGRANALNRTTGPGGGDLRVRLYTNAVVIDHTLTLGSLIEPTFTGYAPFGSSAWSAPAVDSNDDVYILSPVVIFDGPPSSAGGSNIHGYFVTIEYGAASHLWFAEAFTTPQPLVVATDQIAFQVEIKRRSLAA